MIHRQPDRGRFKAGWGWGWSPRDLSGNEHEHGNAFKEDKTYFESRTLGKGDIILLASGGHGFEMLEPSEIVEVKQGPYAGNLDKTRFPPVPSDQVRVKEL